MSGSEGVHHGVGVMEEGLFDASLSGPYMGIKNLPAKIYKSGQREELKLRFAFANNNDAYIDIAKALSEVNRKHYRQGLYYYIQSVELLDSADGSTVDISTLPDTWVAKNAWIRGYEHWNRINQRSPAPLAKYADFKIRMTSTSASGTVLTPDGHGTSDEWNKSEFNFNKDAETGQMGVASIYMTGGHTGGFPNVTGYGLITGYSETRRNAGDITSADDPIPAGAVTDILMVDGSDGHVEITASKIEENDLTPYDHDNYYGTASSDLTRQDRLATGYGAGRATKIGGFCVPFGLLMLEPNCDGSFSVTITMTPGPYHGVYAERVFDEQ